jgi:hypothetical protein
MALEIGKLTLQDVKDASPSDIRRIMKEPELRAEFQNLLNSPERVAANSTVVIAPDPVEEVVDPVVDPVVVPAAEVVVDPPVVPVVPVVAPPPTPVKLVYEFQARDENGIPIGRRTHLEAFSQEELDKKKEEAYEQAVRAFHRLKSQKPTFNKPVQESLSDEQITKIIEQAKTETDPAKAAEIARGAAQTLSVSEEAAKLREASAKATQAYAEAAGMKIAYEWMRLHVHDYEQNDANSKLMSEYLTVNDMPVTLDNLEIAFNVLESQLSRPEAATVLPAPSPANIPVVAPVVETVAPVVPVAAPVAQPVVEAPATPAVQQNVLAPVKRPGVVGGIVPGQLSGSRPAPGVKNAPKLTMADVKAMSREDYKKAMKNPAMRAEIERVARSAPRKGMQ